MGFIIIKEALKNGMDIDDKLIIPSHYLRCMKDIYYNKGNLKKIIELADLILLKKENIDTRIERDIRYYLCQALAKRQDSRLLKEVQYIKGDEHSFLLGFYYRICRRYADALDRLLAIVDAPYVGARAKREIVQVYVQLEEYDKALSYAKSNYEENRGNQFHTQAYFNCLINSENFTEHESDLQSLIGNFRRIDSEQSNEMADIAESLFFAKIKNNKTKSLQLIKDTIAKYPDNYYPIFALCDIAIQYSDLRELEVGIDKLERWKHHKTISHRTVSQYKAFAYLLKGNKTEAMALIQENLDNFPEDSKVKIIQKLKHYKE